MRQIEQSVHQWRHFSIITKVPVEITVDIQVARSIWPEGVFDGDKALRAPGVNDCYVNDFKETLVYVIGRLITLLKKQDFV